MKADKNTKARASKKPYTSPHLTRYGDLKTLTGGGRRARNESASGPFPGPKTRPNTPV